VVSAEHAAAESLETAPHRAMRLIRARISDGTFPPMSRLPRETDLAGELGVSRAALREAIRAMELLGILESRHGSGTYVTSLRLSALLPSLAHSGFLLNSDSVPDLVEIRLVVEPAFSARAARNATDADRVSIRSAFEQMEQTTDPVGYARLDAQFHQSIVRAAGNEVMASVLEALTYGAGWQHMWGAVTRDFVPARTRYEHEQLVIAIETGDPDLAFSVAYAHIAAVNGRLRDLGEGQNDPRSTP
jgi:GntR family transcriptional repressor for pyruvate dehydrogenase complex